MTTSVSEQHVSFFEKHPRVMNFLWSAPFLVFLVFPFNVAMGLGLGTLKGLLCLLLILSIAASSIASWVLNPVPPVSERVTRTFIATFSVLLGSQVAYWLLALTIPDVHMSFLMLGYPGAVWILQSTRKLLLPGAGALIAVTVVEILIAGDPLWGICVVPASLLICGLSRWGMTREQEREKDHQRALLITKERERTRLSADLHDILGHSLTGIALKAQVASQLMELGRNEEARTHVDDLLTMSREALADVRAIVAATRVVTPAEEIDAARDLLGVIGADLEVVGNVDDIPVGSRALLAGHVIREGVTNALAHAYPTRVRLVITANEVSVTNDGYNAQFSQRSSGSGLGLDGLRERVGDAGSVSWGANGRYWTLTLRFADEETE